MNEKPGIFYAIDAAGMIVQMKVKFPVYLAKCAENSV